jgi:Dyp-type peroxidase family
MLELDQIQATLLRGARFNQAHYLFVRFQDAAQGQAWVRKAADLATSTAAWDLDPQWTLNVAFTSSGLEALGLDPAVCASFPEAFRDGMAARHLIGDTGESDPAHWEFGGPTTAAHALLIVSTRDATDYDTFRAKYREFVATLPAVAPVYLQDGHHPDDGREHFGYRDPISQPAVEGSARAPPPGQLPVLKAGEFVLGSPDERGQMFMPTPPILGRNGSYLAVRKFHQRVAAFRAYLARHAEGAAAVEKLAAKMVGRWRSGAPLLLAPERDDPELGGDPQRNDAFLYDADELDPEGLRCPLGAHGRRTNPRDTAGVLGVQRHRLLRGGSIYGPKLPEDASEDDGVERGLFGIFMCADIERQFEFVHNIWINDGNFVGQGADRDPLVGANAGHGQFVIPQTPIRRRLQDLPSFTVVCGGDYFFLPSLAALRWLGAEGADEAR